MCRIIILMLCSVVLALQAAELPADMQQSLTSAINAHAKIATPVKAFVIKELLPISGDEVLTTAVAAQNGKAVSLADIQAIDKKWKAAEDEIPAMTAAMENPAAERLFAFVEKHPQIIEVFVMDNQGAVVAESALTSDYWQGDEAKWQNSFAKGQGGIDVGDEELDASSNQVIQQISLPIVSGGKVIGAVTWGIDVGSLK